MRAATDYSPRLSIFSEVICALIVLAAVLAPGTAKAGERVLYYHNDTLGSPVAITDKTGAIVWSADYEPFGATATLTPNAPNSHQFIGKERDPETGLSYFGARYYDSEIGLFVSTDPALQDGVPASAIQNPGFLNHYAYSANNPYRYKDPDGEWLEKVLRGAGDLFNPSAANGPTSQAEADNAERSISDGQFILNQLPIPTGMGSNRNNVADAGKKVTEKERARNIKEKLNNNQGQVTINTPDKKVEIGLTGKAHHDKVTGQSIPTPHVEESKRHFNPFNRGQVNTSDPTIRSATHQDLRNAEKVLKKRQEVP